MSVLGQVLASAVAIMSIPFTVYGFTFSLWQVFLWTTIAGIILTFLGGLIYGN